MDGTTHTLLSIAMLGIFYYVGYRQGGAEAFGAGFREGLRYRNIVSSQYIADAQIEFVSKGSLNDAQKESWYQKIASVINPF